MSTLKKTSRRTVPAVVKLEVDGKAAPAKTRATQAVKISGSGKPLGGPPVMRVVPPVARRGRLSLKQIKHAVAVALRGQTFEADA
jgi:hypothetical protein